MDNHVENLHYSNGYLTYHNEDLSKDDKMKLEQVTYEVEDKEKFNQVFSSYKDWGQAKEVPQNKIWKISFNRAVNPENLKDQVYVMDSSFNKVTDIDVNVNESKNIVITKKTPYKRGGLYYLVVSKPIKDIKGQEIKEPVVMRFKVY
nr:Ig-like domain-containing protein [Clostridium botulinum]